MARFDWSGFLIAAGVDHVIGPNGAVRSGHVGINCPRCANDTKHFFSIELTSGKVRGCWWDRTHWLSPRELVAELAHVSIDRAKEIIEEGEFASVESPKTLLDELEKDDAPRVSTIPAITTWPEECLRFTRNPKQAERQFHTYLISRGFSNPYAVARKYGLRWCVSGRWKMRVLFPLTIDGTLRGWTGRAITKAARARYLTEPKGDGVRHLIWNEYETRNGGRGLIFCEGPFDALKLDWHTHALGVRAAALLGLNAGSAKLSAAARLARGFDGVAIVLDAGAEAQGMDVAERLAVLAPRVGALPEGRKDPGELRGREARNLALELFGPVTVRNRLS